MDYEALLVTAADLGYRLMVSGAEIYRVEESVTRVLRAYQVRQGEVFAIYNSIFVSCLTPDGRPVSHIRRVGSHGTDLTKMEQYNDLCRHICRETPPLEQVQARMDAIAAGKTYPWPVVLGAYFLGAWAFTLFFQGTFWDALCGGMCGAVIFGCIRFLDRFRTNDFFKNIIASAVSAFLALILVLVGLGTNSDRIIIGAFMTLTPGIALTNTMRDIMAGDLVAGVSKLAEALLTATAIALGTGVALALVRLVTGGALV